METILNKDKKKETQEFLEVLALLNEEEKQELKNFMQGISFIKKYRGNEESKSA